MIIVGKWGEYQKTWSGHALTADDDLQLKAGEEQNDLRITVKPPKSYKVVAWPIGPKGMRLMPTTLRN